MDSVIKLKEAQSKVKKAVREFEVGVEQLRKEGKLTPEAEAQVREIRERLAPLLQ